MVWICGSMVISQDPLSRGNEHGRGRRRSGIWVRGPTRVPVESKTRVSAVELAVWPAQSPYTWCLSSGEWWVNLG